MEDVKQGILIIGTNVLYTCPCDKRAKVTLRFTDMHPYIMVLSRYNKVQNNTVNLWALELDAKDTVVDDTEYHLESNDRLEVACNSATTNYSIFVVETLVEKPNPLP